MFIMPLLCPNTHTHAVAVDVEAEAVLSWMSQRGFAHFREGSFAINPRRKYLRWSEGERHPSRLVRTNYVLTLPPVKEKR